MPCRKGPREAGSDPGRLQHLDGNLASCPWYGLPLGWATKAAGWKEREKLMPSPSSVSKLPPSTGFLDSLCEPPGPTESASGQSLEALSCSGTRAPDRPLQDPWVLAPDQGAREGLSRVLEISPPGFTSAQAVHRQPRPFSPFARKLKPAWFFLSHPPPDAPLASIPLPSLLSLLSFPLLLPQSPGNPRGRVNLLRARGHSQATCPGQNPDSGVFLPPPCPQDATNKLALQG